MDRPKPEALLLAEEILQKEPVFYGLTQRYIGIIASHAELWCATKFNLVLPESGVSEGADAVATMASAKPFGSGDSIQIKARGSETMHVKFRTTGIDWLLIMAYELELSPVKYCCYCFSVKRLTNSAERFEGRYGKSVIPLRRDGEHLRLEWSALKVSKVGRVLRSTDTWEQRAERAREILSEGYSLDGGVFRKGIVLPQPSKT